MSIDRISPQIERILHASIPKLSGCDDYRTPEARRAVNAVFWQLLRFLEYRMDTARGSDPSGAYLFAASERPTTTDERPTSGRAGTHANKRDYHEKRLQLDCMQFLRSGLGNGIHLEQSDIAGGRADIIAQLQRTRLVIEVKREDKDASHHALRSAYGAQATEYSNTSARIGFLLVLDRSRPDGTAGFIEDKISVTTIPKHGDNSPRTLIIVVMPGRRKTPSQLILRER